MAHEKIIKEGGSKKKKSETPDIDQEKGPTEEATEEEEAEGPY